MRGEAAIELRRLGKDSFPLPQEQQRAQSMLSFVIGFALSIAFGIAQSVLVLLHQAFAAWGLGRGAASRVAQLEYPR